MQLPFKTRIPGLLGFSFVALVLVSSGCVRRTLTITTEPSGALVWLNDEEVGRSPANVDFLWYGDYDVVARLDGHQTLITHHQIKAPWYQAPGIDFLAEVLYPAWIHDQRQVHFQLAPESLPEQAQLLQSAEEFREEALFQAQ